MKIFDDILKKKQNFASFSVAQSGEMNFFDIGRRLVLAKAIDANVRKKYGAKVAPRDVADWKRFIRFDAHLASSRKPSDAECLSFSAKIGGGGKMRFVTDCFVKIAYKAGMSNKHDARIEQNILQTDLKRILTEKASPCLPLHFDTFRLPNSIGLSAWDEYRTLVKRVEKETRFVPQKNAWIDVLVTENCGRVTLKGYIRSIQSDNQVFEIFLMLFHTLGVLSTRGIGHNDLHFDNIIVKETEPTVVCFGGRTFRTTKIPVIVDWDLGRGTCVANELYEHVGIFKEHLPHFDLFGMLKCLFYLVESRGRSSCRVIDDESTIALTELLRDMKRPVRERHPWLFKYKFRNEFGEELNCIQQTPFVPVDELFPTKDWPEEVGKLTPSFDAFQDALYDQIVSEKGIPEENPAFCF